MSGGKQKAERFLDRFAANVSEDAESGQPIITTERQSGEHPFALSVYRKDGRGADHFAWSTYGGHAWRDEGQMEAIIIAFGLQGVKLTGYRFRSLDLELAKGKRASIVQHSSRQVQMMLSEDGDEPILVEVEIRPTIEEFWNAMKGDDENETRHSGRVNR